MTRLFQKGAKSVAWGTFNMVILVLSVWFGFLGVPLDFVRGANPKWLLCVIAFVVFVLNVPLWLHFAPACKFRTPQWGRSPLSWSYDPLQFFFMSTCCWAGLIVGLLSRLFHLQLITDMNAVWSLFVYVAVFAGLLVGQALAYIVYKDRIEDGE